jgi:biopolymer transport protein ExbD
MNRRPLLTLPRRRSLPAQPGLSLLDAAFVSVLFAVAAASFLQIPIQALNPFQQEAVAVELPTRIVVWVQPEGRLDVNGQAVADAGLEARLRELVVLRPDLTVEVIARGAVDNRVLAATLSAAKRAGAAGVQLTQLDPLAAATDLHTTRATLVAGTP